MVLVRKNERREVRRDMMFACQVIRERDFRLVADLGIDLSPDGMLALTDEYLVKGESVIVSFRATHLGIWFDTEAKVSRVIRGRRPGDKGRGVGLCFESLDKVKRHLLRGHLRKVPPPLPKRAQRIDWTRTVMEVA